ncbi:MAG TPA: hypothetical protein VIM31_03455 [Candidatus Microsaccharimonas sp.]|jgi:hypothetical protein
MPAQFSYKNDSDEDQRVSPEETARQLQEQEQQSAYDRDFDALTDPEHLKKDGVEGDTGSGDSAKVRDAEDSGGNWKSSYGGNKAKAGKKLTPMNVRAILKKRGPLGLIALLGLGGGLVGTALFSPGLLLVQMKEALVDRFDTQLTSMDARTNKLLNQKILGSTAGICGAKITIKCKFSTISEKQAGLLKAQGIDVEGNSTKIGSRIKPNSYTFKGGQPMDAKAFAAKIKTDPELSAAMRKAYNPKFAGFADSIWNKVAGKLGVTKQRALADGDDAAKQKALDEQVKNGSKINITNDGVTCDSSGKCTRTDEKGNKVTLTDAEKAARQATIDAAAEITDDAADDASKAALAGIEDGAKTGVTSVANFVKLTGVADTACQAYSSVRALGYAAKTVRAVQLARYAMVFVNTADQIKAGTAKPEDVAYLGGILTNIAYDVKSGVKRKAAMDSAGMKYSMFGDSSGFRGQGSSYISQFMAGGGLTGDLIAVTDYINSVLNPLGGAKSTCATLSNGWVQAGSVIAGIGLMLVPGANVVIGVSDVVKGALNVAAGIGMAVLPELLKTIVAGNVTQGLIGEDSGNAISSGFGVMMSDTAQAGGNATMTIPQAVAYTAMNNDTIARYSKDEAKTLSPLDPSNKDTFLGSIVNRLLPFVSTTGSISNPLTALSSLASSSFASVLPTASAISTEQEKAALSSCTDPDYTELGIAADPFCNLVVGIPAQYLNRDPSEVADSLEGQYDDVTGAPVSGSEYEKYVNNCINRAEPIGSTGSDASASDGSECRINDSNANYYLFYMDQRVDNSMDGYQTGSTAPATSTGDITDKKALAAKIVAKNKIKYSGNVQPKLENIANGTTDPNAEPCGININILKAIDVITDTHSITISDINRHCTNSTANGLSSTSSRHYAGNGSAIDIAVADGVRLTGRDAKSVSIINLAMPVLSAAAGNGQTSSVGQSQCGAAVILAVGVKTFPDGCTHVHLDVPPSSDPNLKHS